MQRSRSVFKQQQRAMQSAARALSPLFLLNNSPRVDLLRKPSTVRALSCLLLYRALASDAFSFCCCVCCVACADRELTVFACCPLAADRPLAGEWQRVCEAELLRVDTVLERCSAAIVETRISNHNHGSPSRWLTRRVALAFCWRLPRQRGFSSGNGENLL